MEEKVNKAIENIGTELRRIAEEEPIKDLQFGAPNWTEKVMNPVLTEVNFGDEVDDVAEAVEELRQEQQDLLLSMTLQALHDDSVNFVAWNLPSGVTAYLVESWNGETELFAIGTEGFSDEEAAHHLSTYIRSVYMGRDPEPDAPEVLQISSLDVTIFLGTQTPEFDCLIKHSNF
ncbi:hypothetical protein VSU19_19775 [Verrucomicrobiales bacterium BCK34]|nr:hypothetical protein [Verrucomicrobiales bacterium BCK34]